MKRVLSNKLILLLLLFSSSATVAMAQRTFPCDSFCVESIKMDSANKDMIDVVIYNESSVFINYPTVQVIYKGDTVGNKKGEVQFYGQMAKSRLTHTMLTTLKSIPANFACTVMLRSQFGKSDTCFLNYPCTMKTSIEEAAKPALVIRIYPDPVSSVLFISTGEASGKPLQVRVYAMDGKEVIGRNITENGNVSSIEVGQLPRGIYMIRVQGENLVYTGKFVRE